MRNLGAGEIVDQVYRAKELLAREEPGRRITNLVYMGMGEPLHNFSEVTRSLRLLTDELGANLSYRRITVSTVGLVPGIRKLGGLEQRPNLAISLNASNDEVRDQVMPINKRFKIAELLQTLREFPLEKRRRLTFEYVLLAGVNDSDDDAERLARLLRGFRCKVNIIPWNPHPDAPYQRPSPSEISASKTRPRVLGCRSICARPAVTISPRPVASSRIERSSRALSCSSAALRTRSDRCEWCRAGSDRNAAPVVGAAGVSAWPVAGTGAENAAVFNFDLAKGHAGD